MRNQKMYLLRTGMNKTQAEVAKAIGIKQNSYSMIELGYRHPRKETMKKLADYFNTTVDELFYKNNNHSM